MQVLIDDVKLVRDKKMASILLPPSPIENNMKTTGTYLLWK
jgi:hypothetical protein